VVTLISGAIIAYLLGGLLIMMSFALVWAVAMVGIARDWRRWLAVLVGVISGGFLLLMWLWNMWLSSGRM
jgi:hypothetical protein